MRIALLALTLAAVGLAGCAGGRTHITTLEVPRSSRAALKLESGSPRVTLNNRGPGAVQVRFQQAGAATTGARVRRGGKVTRDVDTPGKVVVETGPDAGAEVTCVIERMTTFEIEPAKPK